MLKTMNPKEWKENPSETRLREGLTMQSSPILLRRLYPLKAKTVRFCRVHQFEVGTVLEYVRPKCEPSYYPLEALVERKGQVYRSSYGSDEVEIIPL